MHESRIRNTLFSFMCYPKMNPYVYTTCLPLPFTLIPSHMDMVKKIHHANLIEFEGKG